MVPPRHGDTGAPKCCGAGGDLHVTPAKAQASSGSVSHKWWLDLLMLPEHKKVSAWHSNILDPLLSEWAYSNMVRSQQCRKTVDSLSTSTTTKCSLGSQGGVVGSCCTAVDIGGLACGSGCQLVYMFNLSSTAVPLT